MAIIPGENMDEGDLMQVSVSLSVGVWKTILDSLYHSGHVRGGFWILWQKAVHRIILDAIETEAYELKQSVELGAYRQRSGDPEEDVWSESGLEPEPRAEADWRFLESDNELWYQQHLDDWEPDYGNYQQDSDGSFFELP